MLNVFLLPLLAVIGGAGGFFLRRWELTTVFESTGLATPWAAASIALTVLSAVMVLAFALLCRGAKNELTEYSSAFSAVNNWGYLLIAALSSAHLLIAGISFLALEYLSGAPHILRVLLGAMCILSFFCILSITLSNFRGKGRKYSLVLLAPGYTFCLWLVSAYQQRAADPVILDYVYELFAIICSLLALYFAAAFSFAKSRVWRCSFFSLLSIYFSIVTLADSHARSSLLLLIFTILYQLATVIVLLKNAFIPQPKHLETESNKTQEVIPDE